MENGKCARMEVSDKKLQTLEDPSRVNIHREVCLDLPTGQNHVSQLLR